MPLASVFKNFGIVILVPLPFNLLLHPTHPFPPPCSLPWSPTWILCTDQEPLPLQCASSKTLRFQKKSKIFFFYDKYPIVSIRYFFGGVFQGLLKFSALRCCRTKIQCEMATWTACMYICPPQNFSTQFLLYTAHVCHLHINLLFPRSLSEYIYFHSSPSWSIKLIFSPVFYLQSRSICFIGSFHQLTSFEEAWTIREKRNPLWSEPGNKPLLNWLTAHTAVVIGD